MMIPAIPSRRPGAEAFPGRSPSWLVPPAGARNPQLAANTFLAVGLALAAALPAKAADMDLLLRYGENSGNYRATGVTLRWGPWWSRDWGRWKAALRPELEFSHFHHTDSGPGPETLNQVGGVGLFRLHYGEDQIRPYAEVGLGAALFSRDSLGNKEFSTRFQFSEHAGLGLEFAGKWFAGWRYSHYSNADIKSPNDGIDLHQVVIGARF